MVQSRHRDPNATACATPRRMTSAARVVGVGPLTSTFPPSRPLWHHISSWTARNVVSPTMGGRRWTACDRRDRRQGSRVWPAWLPAGDGSAADRRLQVNAKRVERIWRRGGRREPIKQPKRRNDGSCIRLRSTHRGHVWSYDFVEDRTHDGRKHRVLNRRSARRTSSTCSPICSGPARTAELRLIGQRSRRDRGSGSRSLPFPDRTRPRAL